MSLTFDATYYQTTRPDVFNAFIQTQGSTGLSWAAFAENHYNTFGWLEGSDPSASFDTSYYLSTNVDVAAAGVNPFQHFLTFGSLEDRAPFNGFPTIANGQFVAATYAAANADLAANGITTDAQLYQHFVTFGQFESRPGAPSVDTPNAGNSFTLTADGAVLTSTVSNNVAPAGALSTADDTIDAFTYPTAGTTTISDANSTDADVLNVTGGATAISFGSVSGIETVNVTSVNNGAAINAAQFTGTNTINVLGATDLAVNNFVNNGSVVLGLKGASDVTANAGAGSDDDIFNLAVNGASGSITLADGGGNNAVGVTTNIVATGTNTLTLSATAADLVVDTINVSGAGDLVLTTAVAEIDLNGITIAGTNGTLELITDDTTALDAANWTGVDKLTLTGNYNAAITDLAAGTSVELRADTTSVQIDQAGAADAGSTDDSLTIVLNAATGATTQTQLTADAIETLTINSTTSDDATNVITDLDANALGTLNITGGADLTIGFSDNVDTLDASTFTGDLIADLSTNTVAVLATLGSGDDQFTVSGQADLITTGAGEDTIILADGSSTATTLVKIADFTAGAAGDKLDYDAAATYEAISEANQAAIDAATTLAAAAAQAATQLVANEVTVFIYSGNAYALFEDGTNATTYDPAEDVLVELTGITSSADFAQVNFV